MRMGVYIVCVLDKHARCSPKVAVVVSPPIETCVGNCFNYYSIHKNTARLSLLARARD